MGICDKRAVCLLLRVRNYCKTRVERTRRHAVANVSGPKHSLLSHVCINVLAVH